MSCPDYINKRVLNTKRTYKYARLDGDPLIRDLFLFVIKTGHTIYGTAFYFGEILGKRWRKTVFYHARKIDKTGILGYHQVYKLII